MFETKVQVLFFIVKTQLQCITLPTDEILGYIINQMTHILQSLQQNKLILAPLDHYMAVMVRLSPENLDRLIDIQKRFGFTETLSFLVEDVDSLSAMVFPIHPRIETLLNVHQQSLAIQFPAEVCQHPQAKDGQVYFRICVNTKWKELLYHLGESLAYIALPTEEMSDEIKEKLKVYVDESFPIENQTFSEPAPVKCSYNAKGELEFH